MYFCATIFLVKKSCVCIIFATSNNVKLVQKRFQLVTATIKCIINSLQCISNYSEISTVAIDGWAVTFGTARRGHKTHSR